MTAKKNFLDEVKKLQELLEKEIVSDYNDDPPKEGFVPTSATYHDIDIMIGLDYTPPSWKVWRPKFIEYFSFNSTKFFEEIIYEKKTKTWKIGFNPDEIEKLLVKDSIGITKAHQFQLKPQNQISWIEKFKESSLPSVKPEIVTLGADDPREMIKFVIDPNDPEYIPVDPIIVGKNIPQWDLDGNPIRNKKRDGTLPKNQSVYSQGKSELALPFDMNDIAILSERLGFSPKNWNLSDFSRNQIGALKNILLFKNDKITKKQTGVPF